MRQHMAALLNHATCFMYMESAFSFVPYFVFSREIHLKIYFKYPYFRHKERNEPNDQANTYADLNLDERTKA